MRLNNGGFGTVEIILILALLIVLVAAFGDDITHFVGRVIMYLMQMFCEGGSTA